MYLVTLYYRYLSIHLRHGLAKGALIHSQTTNFRLIRTERVCRRKFRFEFDQNDRKVSKRLENMVG